ncbi:MAG TPA: hypothetical protein VLU46_05315 [Thermoanaerobaculia bacterium]|nr:hypothetical protein [Thermoanaerobaculia bacterium]
MNEERFLERLRGDARQLRHEADDVMASRIAARVRGRISEATIAELIAAWFRPIAASLTALALAATIALTVVERNQAIAYNGDPVELTVGGDVFSVTE